MASFTPQFRKRVSRWSTFKQNYSDAKDFSVRGGEHLWKEIADDQKQVAKDQYGVADFLSFDKKKHDYAIVAVGTTGTGKSSIVQLFCGSDVQVSHATKSQTKTAELFAELGDDAVPNRQWMDTQGTDDTDMDDTDERILKKIFKKLWLKKVHFITVLWLVSGDFDRQKGEYLRQARFIQSLQTDQSKTNIWKSTLMIQKMGTLQPKMKKIRGLIDAAKNNGAKMVYLDEDSIRDHILGFKCIDMINEKGDDPMYEALVDAETSPDKLVQLGYVTRIQMKSIIMERLKKIDCFHLQYKDLICEKCSLRGDPRYLYYKCHHKPIPHHPKKLIPYHPKELEEYHPLNTHVIHPGKVIHIHPKELEEYHPESMVEREIDDVDNPVFDHPGDYITIISGKLCCTKEIQKYNCCQAEAKYAKGCRKQYPKKTIREYPCCKKVKDKDVDEDEKGCDDDFHGGCSKRFLCCLKPDKSDPCTSKYECCDAPPNSPGCTTVYKCCEEDENHPGCKERYKCCQFPDGARGCEDKWECCDQAPIEKGCQTVCDRCKVRWGHKPGCSWPDHDDDNKQDDDDKDIDDPDYGDNYDEKVNPAIKNQLGSVVEDPDDNNNNDFDNDNNLNPVSMVPQPSPSPAPDIGAIPTASVRAMSSDDLL